MENILEHLFTQFETRQQGLAQYEVEERLKKFGKNELTPPKKKHLIIQFFEEFKDLMVAILVIAAIISIIVGERTDGAIITFILILNATIGLVQKYKANKAVEALQKMLSPMVHVIREDKHESIENKYLVPGDIMILNEGDSISADGILVETNEFQTQEAVITGESIPVEKSERNLQANKVLMGTIVAHGSAKAIVTETGMKTKFGNIARLTSETKKDESPLEKEISNIGSFVGKITLGIVIILFSTNVLLKGEPIIQTLIFAVSVAVAAVPEGLPAIITISLAIGTQRLAKKHAIMKQLSSVETLGSTTVILSDKTGTLTKNEMTVKEMFFDKYEAFIDGSGYAPAGNINVAMPDKTVISVGSERASFSSALEIKEKAVSHGLKQIAAIAAMCNNAKLRCNKKDGIWTMVGDPTEGALITMVEKMGIHTEEVEALHERLHELTFDGFRKRMTVIAKNKSNNRVYAYVKGSPDGILKACTHVLMNEREIMMDKETREKILARSEDMAKKALRVIALAYKEVRVVPDKYVHEKIESDLIFIGIVGIIDPPRKEVAKSIELAKSAGVRLYIVTGDHGLTAGAIAETIGLVEKNKYKILTGEDLKELTNRELASMLKEKHEIIFARVSPEDKLRIATTFKEIGEVIAVTGDGVNDAPALKKADIGIAMGSGTDVSKEAANMVLTDDSVATIIRAIEEGRTIYENIKKFLFYVFSSNIGELVTIFAAIAFAIPQPLTAVLILIINLGTDILPALALGVEAPEPHIMKNAPRHPTERILNKDYIFRVFFSGFFVGLLSLTGYFMMLYKYGIQDGALKATTMAFAIMILVQVANAFNARSEKLSLFKLKFFSNKYLVWAGIISIILTLALIEIPLMQSLIKTTHLTIIEWIIAISLSLGIIVIEEIRKFISNKHYKQNIHAKSY
ncbi:MAG: cation-transporting ATPase A, Ca2+-transporting ATPase [Candidatus Peregrinibacteria bacterium GW2011_GWC2_39_14]|nr:MAG: Cation-transporting ATPase A, P type (ATPase, E1-E2 type) [Candidatus Peregrinibacteria bacterium GW2011_GWA2_38_36]KKR06830.1 MAG: cation-transporting ATPase A, Ca2+-transporting ATPase [Candidatus Peregrinibacteria bacterium GW2011_GWC2_39_14]